MASFQMLKLSKLSLSLFLMIDLKSESYIIHLDNDELYHRSSTLEMLTRGDKTQILGSWYFNTILKKFSMTESQKVKQCSCILKYFNQSRS